MDGFDFHRFHFNFMMGAAPEYKGAEQTAQEQDMDRFQGAPPVT
jgi:hypothetical protein